MDKPVKELSEAIALLTKVSAKLAETVTHKPPTKKEKAAPTITKKMLEGLRSRFETPAKKEKPEQVITKAVEVIVSDFGPSAKEYLDKRKSKKDKKITDKEIQDMPFMSLIKKLVGPALLVLGGLSAFVAGLMNTGKLKGFFILLAKDGALGLLKIMTGALSGTVSRLLGSLKNFIPEEGILKLTDQFKRKIVSITESVKNSVTSVLTSISRGITKGIPEGGLISGIIKSIKDQIPTFSRLASAPLKVIGKLNLGMFEKLAGFAAKSIKVVIKRLPLIGSFISWASAWSRFKSGDPIGGAIDIVSGIATLVPGYGTALSIGLDAFNAILDWKGGEGTGKERTGKKIDILGSWTKSLWSVWTKLPIVRNFTMFGEGIGEVIAAGGNLEATKDGLLKMAYAIPGFGMIASVIGGAESYEEAKSLTSGMGTQTQNVFGDLVDYLKMKTLMMLPESVFGFAIRSRVGKMFGIDMGPITDEKIKAIHATKDKPIKQVHDFIQTPDGNVVQPDKDDTIIGAKSGGVFDKHFSKSVKLAETNNNILKNLTESSTSLLSKQVNLITESNKLLRQMIESAKKTSANIVTTNSVVNNITKGMSLRDLQLQNT